MLTFMAHWYLFVILNFLAGASALLWGIRCTSSRKGLVEFLANWITAILAQIVLVQTVLGVFGWLNSWSTLIVLGAVFFVSLVLFKRANGTFRISAQWGKDLQSIAQFLRKEKSAQVVLLLIVWILLGFSIAALAEPSTLWDAFAYHLPMAADWMQNQRLQPSYIPWADISNSYFPGNGELLYLWALAPFHNDLLVRVVSVCMWLVLAIALFRVCWKVGASGQASLVATILFLFFGDQVLWSCLPLTTVGRIVFCICVAEAVQVPCLGYYRLLRSIRSRHNYIWRVLVYQKPGLSRESCVSAPDFVDGSSNPARSIQ